MFGPSKDVMTTDKSNQCSRFYQNSVNLRREISSVKILGKWCMHQIKVINWLCILANHCPFWFTVSDH